MLFDVGFNCMLQIDDGVKDAPFQASFCQSCEKAFNGVEPA